MWKPGDSDRFLKNDPYWKAQEVFLFDRLEPPPACAVLTMEEEKVRFFSTGEEGKGDVFRLPFIVNPGSMIKAPVFHNRALSL